LATVDAENKGIDHDVRIMIPNVTTFAELKQIRTQAEAVIDAVNERKGTDLKFQIGSMIEFPRAAATADQIAEYADFFSFGTNDLTQTTLGFSRDDYGKFIDSYLDQKVLDSDPFKTLDADGVGAMIEIAEAKGRSVDPSLHLGICGEHGGDPASIELCYKLGLNYVSCSPFRVPAARLAGAQAVIKAAKAEKGEKAPAKRGRKAASAKAEKKTTTRGRKAAAEKKTTTRGRKASASKTEKKSTRGRKSKSK
ncbi:MAG: pyruvate, phosphate dikinase, partial [Treponema sp.]|nr:pyruvate, phosphate dikinase [Treponema sp.]